MKAKIQNFFTLPRLLAFFGLSLLVVASSMKPLDAQQVTQGYGSDHTLERGMIVRLSEDDGSKVEPVKAADDSRMFGVVVAPNDAPFTLSSEGAKVFVATNGRYEVLVSNQNGEITDGDYIVVSTTDGIGMKADDNAALTIGKALEGFNGSAKVTGSASVNGRTVEYGRVLAEVAVAPNPSRRSDNTLLPSFLSRAAQSATGKPVSTPRIYLGLVMIIATMVVTGSLIYGGVRSSITAIGRNPLAKASVGANLMKVIVTGLLIFAGGLFAVYWTLKL